MADYVPNTVVKILQNVPLDDTYTDTRWFSSVGDQTGFFPQMVEDDMPRGRRDERSRAFRPLDDDRRPARQVVLPADREHVVLAVQAVEVHVDQQGDSPSRGRIGCVFLDDAEGRRRHAPAHAQGGGEPLGERRLASAEVAFQADDVAGTELGRQLPRQVPRFFDRTDLKRALHLSTPSNTFSHIARKMPTNAAF